VVLSTAVVASSATFAVMASYDVLASAAFSAIIDAATEASLTVEVDPSLSEPPGIVDALALGSGYSAVATPGACCPNNGGPLTMDPPLRDGLILLCRGTSSSSDDTSVLLSTIRGATLPFPLCRARSSARATLATGYVCPRDLDAPRIVSPLSCYDVDIV
jgi:hypothetical protein